MSPLRRLRSIPNLALLALCACSGAPQGAKGVVQPLPVGVRAPDLVGEDPAGKPVRLSEVGSHFALVYFYPKDETPGCTKEACAFRDAFERYGRAGVVIFGVSRDSQQSHREFRKKHSLPFPLVADESGAIQQAYGVPSRYGGLAKRMSFLIDPKGLIAHVWPDVDPGVHAEEVLSTVQSLRAH